METFEIKELISEIHLINNKLKTGCNVKESTILIGRLTEIEITLYQDKEYLDSKRFGFNFD